MSKFLAPIRFWPYDKIKVQEELTAALADFAHEKGWDDGIDCSSYVSCDLPALDTVIDEGNIHGWLQARIVDAEGRYAQLVSALVSADPTRMDALQEAAEQFDKRHAVRSMRSVLPTSMSIRAMLTMQFLSGSSQSTRSSSCIPALLLCDKDAPRGATYSLSKLRCLPLAA